MKDLLKIVPSEILLLQETKIEEEALLLPSKTKWNLNVGKVVSVRGTSGGLATLWSADKFQLNNRYATQHWSVTDLFHISSKIFVSLFNLYVHVNYIEKKVCWKLLTDFLEVNSLENIIIVGGLNISLTPNEKKGGQRGKDFMHDTVEELIQVWDLIDLKPKLGRFTWSNHRVGATSISARLDLFLVHNSLLDGKSIISSKILPKLMSNHPPISLLFEKEEELGPIPFRFSPLWIERDGFMDIVS